MSTIQDALRKAQSGRDSQKPLSAGQAGLPAGQAGAVAAAPAAISAPAGNRPIEVHLERGKHGMNWGPIFVVLVLLLITGPILVPLFATPFKRAAQDTAPQQRLAAKPAAIAENETRQTQFAIEEMPLPFVQLPSLNLSGVVYAPNEDSYAIINDKIVKSGESVGGAKVVRVSADKVTLMYQGQVVDLPVAS